LCASQNFLGARIHPTRSVHLKNNGLKHRTQGVYEMTKVLCIAAAFTLFSLGAAALLMQAAQIVA